MASKREIYWGGVHKVRPSTYAALERRGLICDSIDPSGAYKTLQNEAAFQLLQAYECGSFAPIKPSQRIRVLVRGIGVYCHVRDIASDSIRAIVDAMNAERAAGNPCIGMVRDHIQVDIC